MSRFWLIPLVMLAGCASVGVLPSEVQTQDSSIEISPAQDQTVNRTAAKPSGPVALTVEAADIDGALKVFLSADSDGMILLPNRLDRAALDYSLDSLKTVDKWLADLHKINKLQAGEGKAGEYLMLDGRGDNSVTLAGLYLGEVIRANSDLDWKWERFDLFLKANPNFAEHYGTQAGLDTFVLSGPQGVSTPINTALKRVILGKEESLHYIGGLLVNEIDLKQALSGQNLYGLDKRDSID